MALLTGAGQVQSCVGPRMNGRRSRPNPMNGLSSLQPVRSSSASFHSTCIFPGQLPMTFSTRHWITRLFRSSALIAATAWIGPAHAAQPLVPGTGQHVVQVGDDFEDTEWNWIPNF